MREDEKMDGKECLGGNTTSVCCMQIAIIMW